MEGPCVRDALFWRTSLGDPFEKDLARCTIATTALVFAQVIFTRALRKTTPGIESDETVTAICAAKTTAAQN